MLHFQRDSAVDSMLQNEVSQKRRKDPGSHLCKMTRASLRSCSMCSVPNLARMDTRDAHSLVRVPCKANTTLYQEWTPLSASSEGIPSEQAPARH